MIGKASDIKLNSFNFLENYQEWAKENPNAEIIDMKFQASQAGSIMLVIYKEASK